MKKGKVGYRGLTDGISIRLSDTFKNTDGLVKTGQTTDELTAISPKKNLSFSLFQFFIIDL